MSFCKQGRLSACQELLKTDPQKYAKLQAELAKVALQKEAFKVAEEAAQGQEDANAGESSGAEAAESETAGVPAPDLQPPEDAREVSQ